MAGLTKAIICLTTAPQLQKHSEHQRYLTLDTVIRVLPRSFTVVQVCRMRLTTGCGHLRLPPYHLVVSLEHTALLSQCPRPYRPPSTTATVTVTPLPLLCSFMSSSPGPSTSHSQLLLQLSDVPPPLLLSHPHRPPHSPIHSRLHHLIPSPPTPRPTPVVTRAAATETVPFDPSMSPTSQPRAVAMRSPAVIH